jgi:hypothetical protein
MIAQKEGYKYCIASVWQEIARAHKEIDSGSGERIFGSRSKLADEPRGVRVLSQGATGGQEWKTDSGGTRQDRVI